MVRVKVVSVWTTNNYLEIAVLSLPQPSLTHFDLWKSSEVNLSQAIKAILRDGMGAEKFYFSLFFIIHYVMTLVVTVL